MKQPMQDHLDKMQMKAKTNYDRVIKEMGEVQGKEYILSLEQNESSEGDQYSAIGMEARACLHQNEIYALINALNQSKYDKNEEKTYTIPYKISVVENGVGSYKNLEHKMIRKEIVERLKHITFEDYGDDSGQWKKWVSFRKEHGFFRGR